MKSETKQDLIWGVARSFARRVQGKKPKLEPHVCATLVSILGMLKDDPAPDFEVRLKELRSDVNRVKSQLNID